jgi:hypothetical protein
MLGYGHVLCQKRCGTPLQPTSRGHFVLATEMWAAEHACPTCGERVDLDGVTPTWKGIQHPWPQDLLELADTSKRAHGALLAVGNEVRRLAEALPMIDLPIEHGPVAYLPVRAASAQTIVHVYGIPEDGWLADLAHAIVVRAGALLIAQRGMQLGPVLDITIRTVMRAARKEALPCAVLGDPDAAEAWNSMCRPASLVLDWHRDHALQALEHLAPLIPPVKRAKRWQPPD